MLVTYLSTCQASFLNFVELEMPKPEPATHEMLPALPRGNMATSHTSLTFERAFTKFHGPVVAMATRPE